MKNDYSKFSVTVGGGSGCVFKVHGVGYMYVLTSKHLVNGGPVTVKRQLLDVNDLPQELPLNILGGPYLHSDDKKDAALLKVEIVEEIESLARFDDPLEVVGELTLAGFPNTRANKPYQYRQDRLRTKNKVAYGYVESQLTMPSRYGEIVGLSGGGIYHTINGQHYLAGIQSQMAADDDDEMLSNIEIMPLSFFDEVISENPELAFLVPQHLACFSTLRSYAMKLEGCFGTQQMAFTKSYLQGITDDIIANRLTPTMIRNFFASKLLVFEQSQTVLGSRGLWIAWLEFLIIIRFIRDEQITDSNIERVFDEVRLIYSDTEGDWTDELARIFRSDFYGMSPNAKVIIATQNKPEKCFIPKNNNIIRDIIETASVTQREMKIDVGIIHPIQNFKLMHLHAFQRHGIIEKEHEYSQFSALNEPELLAKLKSEFNALIA